MNDDDFIQRIRAAGGRAWKNKSSKVRFEITPEMYQAGIYSVRSFRPAVGTRVRTPLGDGIVQLQAFPNCARVLLDETDKHLASLVDISWEKVQPL